MTEATSSVHDRLTVPNRVKVRVSGPVAAGVPGMFDQGEGRIRGNKFYCRGIDDLGGASAALAMLDALHKAPLPQRSRCCLPGRRRKVSSAPSPPAQAQAAQEIRPDHRDRMLRDAALRRQGNGVIIRVGDRTSTFNSQLTYFLTQQAESLAKSDKRFKFQRLMPGGTCEATVYDVYGYSAASICVPLGNYHNMDREKKRIAPDTSTSATGKTW